MFFFNDDIFFLIFLNSYGFWLLINNLDLEEERLHHFSFPWAVKVN